MIQLIFIGLLIGILSIAGMWYYWYIFKSKPVQPIAFTHHLHIETVSLKCDHCHLFPDKSTRAGIPSISICMKCHERAVANKPEIKKIKKYWDKKEPIPWIRVHTLPWHLHFTHQRHVKEGIECTRCHGQVQTMTTVRQVRTMEMNFCVHCHRNKRAPTDCLTCHK